MTQNSRFPRSIQSQRTSSPEFLSPPPASHSSNQHPALLSTSTSSLQCPVSFRHHWTHFLLLSLVFDWLTNLLCHPQPVVLVLSPLLRLSVLHFPSRIPHSGSIHDLLEQENTGLNCSSPVEVSSYPSLTCFLLSLIDFNKHLCSTLSQSLWVNP